MNQKQKFTFLAAVAAASLALVFTVVGQSQTKAQISDALRARSLPLEFNQKIPLSIESHPVQWRTNTYRLVKLGSIQFNLDKESSRLKAEVQGRTTSFDDVDYDISAAVFEASGTLLGAARTGCQVQRVWLGKVLTTEQTLALDFGVSLDYASASFFTIGISHRKVLTPDDWQKSK